MKESNYITRTHAHVYLGAKSKTVFKFLKIALFFANYCNMFGTTLAVEFSIFVE
jgi:hypothetical protein